MVGVVKGDWLGDMVGSSDRRVFVGQLYCSRMTCLTCDPDFGKNIQPRTLCTRFLNKVTMELMRCPVVFAQIDD